METVKSTTELVVKNDSFNNLVTELVNLGLTRTQATLYLYLTHNSDLSIQELVNRTRIPRTSVYENLNVLLKLGLVAHVVADKKSKFSAYKLGLMSHSIDEQIAKLRQDQAKLQKIEKQINLLSNDQSLQTSSIRYFKGISGARQLIWNSLKAENQVYVYSSWGRSDFVGKRYYQNFVGESKARSIKEKVLINPTPEKLAFIIQQLGAPTSRTVLKDIRVLRPDQITIHGETFMYNDVYGQIYLDAQQINGFEIESNQFIKTQRSIFETLWKIALPIAKLV